MKPLHPVATLAVLLLLPPTLRAALPLMCSIEPTPHAMESTPHAEEPFVCSVEPTLYTVEPTQHTEEPFVCSVEPTLYTVEPTQHTEDLVMLADEPAPHAAAPDLVMAPPDSLRSCPRMVWQSPVAAAAAGTALLAGSSTLFFEPSRQLNVLIRDNVQSFRNNSMSGKALHIDNYIQYIPMASAVGLSLLGVPAEHSSASVIRRSALSLAITGAVVLPLKYSIGKMRPDNSTRNSFPSGHSAFAFVGAETLRLEYSNTSAAIPIAGYSIATITALLRVYNNRHWAGDILCGSVIGILAADLSSLINNHLDNTLFGNKKPKTPSLSDNLQYLL